jgi:hypothetical protein
VESTCGGTTNACTDLDTYEFAFRADQDLAPLVKEGSFLGKTFTIPVKDHVTPLVADLFGVTKKVSLGTDEAKAFKQGHWTERVLQRQKVVEVKSLARGVAGLQLEPLRSDLVAETTFTKDTEFKAGSWAGVDWKTLLLPQGDERAPTPAD